MTKLFSFLSEFEVFLTIIKGSKEVTIFAPSNLAFAKLPAGTLEGLTREEKEKILARHIIPDDELLSADITNSQVSTLLGEDIMLLKKGVRDFQIYHKGKLINVFIPDLRASNGVIHIINDVIL